MLELNKGRAIPALFTSISTKAEQFQHYYGSALASLTHPTNSKFPPQVKAPASSNRRRQKRVKTKSGLTQTLGCIVIALLPLSTSFLSSLEHFPVVITGLRPQSRIPLQRTHHHTPVPPIQCVSLHQQNLILVPPI